MATKTSIVIAEPSDVVRRGIRSILTEPGLPPVSLTEVSGTGRLRDLVQWNYPDVIILNPCFSSVLSPVSIRKESPRTRCVMIQSSLAEGSTAHLYDEVISLYDPAVSIRERLRRLVLGPDPVQRPEQLSPREKDIVVCLVKGMTNRQVAGELNLSPHTVGTHRRNISAKLDIHSTSGLTIYAISNNLVSLDELGPRG